MCWGPIVDQVLSLPAPQAGPPQTPAAAAPTLQPGEPQPQQHSPAELQAMYRHFLETTCVKEFHRLSRSLPDIRCQAHALWPKYLSGAAPQQQQQQQLHDDEVGCPECRSGDNWLDVGATGWMLAAADISYMWPTPVDTVCSPTSPNAAHGPRKSSSCAAVLVAAAGPFASAG
jgi:hypothetical protein